MWTKKDLEQADISIVSWYLDGDINDVTYSFKDQEVKRKILEYDENLYSKVECFNAFSAQYVVNDYCRFTINDVDSEYWFNELVIKPKKRCIIETVLSGYEEINCINIKDDESNQYIYSNVNPYKYL